MTRTLESAPPEPLPEPPLPPPQAAMDRVVIHVATRRAARDTAGCVFEERTAAMASRMPILAQGTSDSRRSEAGGPPEPFLATIEAVKAFSHRASALFASTVTATLIVVPLACGGGTPPAESPAPKPSEGAAAPPSNSASAEGDASAPKPAASSTTETRTTEVIQKVVLANRGKVRACYDEARKNHEGLRGKLTLKFVLDPGGKVKSAEPVADRTDLDAPEVVTCAIDALRAIEFPPSSRGRETTVHYPFDFKPDGAAKP